MTDLRRLTFAVEFFDTPTLYARLFIWGDLSLLRQHCVYVEQVDKDFAFAQIAFIESNGHAAIRQAKALALSISLNGVTEIESDFVDDADLLDRLRRPIIARHWNAAPEQHHTSPFALCR